MPDWRSVVRQRLAPLGLAPAAESDLVDEVAGHLEDRFRELSSGGASADEAYRQTVAELEDLYPLRAGTKRYERMPKNEVSHAGQSSSGNLIEGLWKDLRYAARSMRKSPVFVLFVVLTLGLGIGANTTVFTLINTADSESSARAPFRGTGQRRGRRCAKHREIRGRSFPSPTRI